MNHHQRSIRKEYTTFLEKPGTGEEENIIKTIKDFLLAFNRHDTQKLHDYIAPEATVDSFIFTEKSVPAATSSFLSKKVLENIQNVYWDDISISVSTDKKAARISGAMTVVGLCKTKCFGYAQTMTKNGQLWTIIHIESFQI